MIARAKTLARAVLPLALLAACDAPPTPPAPTPAAHAAMIDDLTREVVVLSLGGCAADDLYARLIEPLENGRADTDHQDRLLTATRAFAADPKPLLDRLAADAARGERLLDAQGRALNALGWNDTRSRADVQRHYDAASREFRELTRELEDLRALADPPAERACAQAAARALALEDRLTALLRELERTDAS